MRWRIFLESIYYSNAPVMVFGLIPYSVTYFTPVIKQSKLQRNSGNARKPTSLTASVVDVKILELLFVATACR